MIITITLIISSLVALNFLLLMFSCNKTTKRMPAEKPVVLKTIKAQKPTKILTTSPLAATGS